MDHVGRISLSAIAVWIALFVMNVFRSKLLENAYQISFQTLVADISLIILASMNKALIGDV